MIPVQPHIHVGDIVSFTKKFNEMAGVFDLELNESTAGQEELSDDENFEVGDIQPEVFLSKLTFCHVNPDHFFVVRVMFDVAGLSSL